MSGRKGQPRGPAKQDLVRPAAPAAAARRLPATAAPTAQPPRSATPTPATGVTAGPAHRDSPLTPPSPNKSLPLPPRRPPVPAGWEEAYDTSHRLYNRPPTPPAAHRLSDPGSRRDNVPDVRSVVHGERPLSPIRRNAPRPRDEESSPEERKRPRHDSTPTQASESTHPPSSDVTSNLPQSRTNDSAAASRDSTSYAEIAATPRRSPTPTAAPPPAPASQAEEPPIQKPRRYPPIVVTRFDDWVTHMAELARRLGHPANARPYSTGMRFIPRSEEEQRVVRDYLAEATRGGSVNADWYCYAPPEERPLKVAILGLPQQTDPTDIVAGLRDLGFPANYARHIPTRRGRSGCTYYASLDPMSRSELARLYATEVFLYLPGVRIVAWRGRQGPPQCHRCQAYGHSSANCHRPPRCVRCGGPHPAAGCERPREAPPTCANCGGTHTANDRRCREFRRLARKRNQRIAPPIPVKPGAAGAHTAHNKAPPRSTRAPGQAPPPQSAPDERAPNTTRRRRRRKRGPRRGRRSAKTAPNAHSTPQPPMQAQVTPDPQPHHHPHTVEGRGKLPPPTPADALPAVERGAHRAPPALPQPAAQQRHPAKLRAARPTPYNYDFLYVYRVMLDFLSRLSPAEFEQMLPVVNEALIENGYEDMVDLQTDAEESEMECDYTAPPSTQRPTNTST